MSKQKKTCPRCGAEFYCHHDSTCWCLNLEVPERLKEQLSMDYADCLCEACLLELGALKRVPELDEEHSDPCL